MAFRKRTYASAFGNRFGGRFKRRRNIFRRRRFARGIRRQVNGLSTNSLFPKNTSGFRSRFIKKRRYRSMIYRDTIFKSHWRSTLATGSIITTPNNITQMTVSAIPGLVNGAGVEFWTAAGGANPINSAGAVANFGSTITLRGGWTKITVGNPNENLSATGGDVIRCVVYGVWSKPNPNVGLFPRTEYQSWDPSILPDFYDDFGKVMFRKDFFLPVNGGAEEITFRYKPMRIDTGEFSDGSRQFYWLIGIGQVTNAETVPVAESATAVVSHNVSFVGDEV